MIGPDNMCGISGIVAFKKSSTSLTHIKQMATALRHRGPDDEGYSFFHPTKEAIWQYGGNDTPENVYRSNFAYTPNQSYSGQIHEDATIALDHRRLSKIGLSPSEHLPLYPPPFEHQNDISFEYLPLKFTLNRHFNRCFWNYVTHEFCKFRG